MAETSELSTAEGSTKDAELSTLRAEVDRLQADLQGKRWEIEAAERERDAWRENYWERMATCEEAERTREQAFLDLMAYVRGESPSLLTDECVDAARALAVERSYLDSRRSSR